MTNGMTRQLILNSLFLLAALLICGQASAQVSPEHARIIEQSKDLAAFKQYLAEHKQSRYLNKFMIEVEDEKKRFTYNDEGTLQITRVDKKYPLGLTPAQKYILLNKNGRILILTGYFETLPNLDFFGTLPKLKGLYVSCSYPKKLQLNLEGFPNLEELVLSRMDIIALSLNISSRKLKYLSIYINPLKKLTGLGNYPAIEVLELPNAALSQIEGLEKLSNLRHLDVSCSQVTVLPDFKNLPNLEKLELGSSKVAELSNIHTLKKLILLEFGLSPASKNTKRFPKSLKDLSLFHEELKEIPADIANLKNLESLRVTGSVEKIEHISGLPNLKTLILTGNNITKIENLRDLPKIEVLYLSHNPITKIEGLDSLCSLKELYLSHTKVTKIENLNKLKNLIDLYLKETPVKSIETLDVIPTVKYLNLFQSDVEFIDTEELKNRDIELSVGYTPFDKKLKKNNERLYYQLLRENKLY
jgi:Leucine-rich repeat (LRR) protein